MSETITFTKEAFDQFMVQVAARNLLTPNMGEILNHLLENEVAPIGARLDFDQAKVEELEPDRETINRLREEVARMALALISHSQNDVCTDNDFLVGRRSDGMLTIPILGLPAIDRTSALRFAAWLVALADDNDEFATILEAVRST